MKELCKRQRIALSLCRPLTRCRSRRAASGMLHHVRAIKYFHHAKWTNWTMGALPLQTGPWTYRQRQHKQLTYHYPITVVLLRCSRYPWHMECVTARGKLSCELLYRKLKCGSLVSADAGAWIIMGHCRKKVDNIGLLLYWRAQRLWRGFRCQRCPNWILLSRLLF